MAKQRQITFSGIPGTLYLIIDINQAIFLLKNIYNQAFHRAR